MANLTETAAKGSLAHKPNLKDLEMLSDDEALESEGRSSMDGDDDDMEEGESDIEDDLGNGKAA